MNNKTAALLAVPCLLALIVLYVTGLGLGYSSDSSFHAPSTPVSVPSDTEVVSTNGTELNEDAGSGFEMAMDVVLKLIVVVGLIFATTKALQYVSGRARGQDGSRALIRVVESRNLAQNQVLHLVEVGGKLLLVGATGSQLTALTEITDGETVENLRARIEDNCGPQVSFAQHLQTLTSRLQSKTSAPVGSTLRPERIREITTLVRGVTAEVRQATAWRSNLRPILPREGSLATAEDQSLALQ